jgi:hypothetical protein
MVMHADQLYVRSLLKIKCAVHSSYCLQGATTTIRCKKSRAGQDVDLRHPMPGWYDGGYRRSLGYGAIGCADVSPILDTFTVSANFAALIC